jgi:glycerol kinase
MTDKKYIVALDQGTTSSRAVVMDHDANIVSVSQREFEQIYPKPGWVEKWLILLTSGLVSLTSPCRRG